MDTTRLIEVIERETGVEGISLATRLDSLVADSLEFLSLIVAVEGAFAFKIPDEKYMEVQIVGDLHNFIHDYVSN